MTIHAMQFNKMGKVDLLLNTIQYLETYKIIKVERLKLKVVRVVRKW
jgi:hypothetical protein